MPSVALAAFLEADDIERAWNDLDLVEQRRLLKTFLDIRIEKAPQMGGKFDCSRIKIAPRFAVPLSYIWTTRSRASEHS